MIDPESICIKLDKNSGFRKYVFSKDEMEYCESMATKYEHYTARFAAKVALLKGMSTGPFNTIIKNEMSVTFNKMVIFI